MIQSSIDPAYTRQTQEPKAENRNVKHIVATKFQYARTKRSPSNYSNLQQRKIILDEKSAFEFPPALACIKGLGSEPFSLYQCVVMERLHVFDLVVSRDLPDKAFKLFESADYNKGNASKAQLVRIANARFREIPTACSLNLSPTN